MKYNVTARFISTVLSTGFILNTQAAGFQLAEYSATGLGRAFAGEAAMADNASAQARNPALLTQFTAPQFSVGAIYVNPNIKLTGTAASFPNPITGQSQSITTHANNVIGNNWIPNAYFAIPLNDRWFAGLAVNSNYGLSTDIEKGFAATQFGNHTSITTVEINPNIAYKLNNQWQFGAGVRYITGKGSIGATAPTYLSANPMTKPLAGQTLKYMEGSDHDFAWNVGAVWQPTDQTRIGASYRSEVKLDLSGHANGLAYNPMNPSKKIAGVLPLTLPATAELAAVHNINAQWAIHSSINWTQWSKFDSLVANIDGIGRDTVKTENWRDTYRLAVGTTWKMDQQMTWRAGIAYDRAAVSNTNRTLSIPETDRYWFSTGVGYAVTPAMTVDVGLTYIASKKAHISEPNGNTTNRNEPQVPGSFIGQTSGDLWLTGVQLSYVF
ncbi:MAG: outer membrane protein transport protein [Plesiomonas sp.]|uniref:outer membrane protein transport protein n=1 Tax=Plesiomonas sp. TaxID=2486279 RepID=UPI003F40EE84